MRSEKYRDQSLDYFHFCAVFNRIDFSGYPDVHPATCLDKPECRAKHLLPSLEDDPSLHLNMEILVSRILADHIPFFKLTFDDIIEWHIKHKYYGEMSSKSVVVPLGVLLKNENKGDEMVEIMEHIHQYVPSYKYGSKVYKTRNEEIEVPQVGLKKILFGGDQLTAARSRSAKRARVNSLSQLTRLEGIIPCAEDFHVKLNFLDVAWKYFFSSTSSGEHGTMYQLRNLIGRSNVIADPIRKYKDCDEFFKLLIVSHTLAAALEALKMDSLSDIPQIPGVEKPGDLWMETAEKRKAILQSICGCIIDDFASFQFNKEPKISDDMVDLLHPLATLHFERCHIWTKHFKPTQCIVLNDIVCVLERGWQGGDLLHIASSTNLHSWRESTLPYCSMSLATYQGQIVAIGGIHSSTREDTNQLLTSATGADWTMTISPMPTSRHATSSIGTSSPAVLVVAGGISSDGNALDIVEVLVGDHWNTVDPLPKASHDMQSTLHEENFFFTGGEGNLSIIYKCNINSLIRSGEQSSDQTLPSSQVWKVLDAPNNSVAIVSYSSCLVVIDMSGCISSYFRSSWVKASREGEEMDEVPAFIAAAVLPGEELVLAHEHGGLYRATVSGSARYLRAYLHFISTKESLDLIFLKLIFLGPPRLGKTTVRRRLMGEIIDLVTAGEVDSAQPSTGAVECENVIVSGSSAVGTQSEWSSVECINDEVRMLFHNLVDTISRVSRESLEPTQSEVISMSEPSTRNGAEMKSSLPASLSSLHGRETVAELTQAIPSQSSRGSQVASLQQEAPEILAMFHEAMGSKYWKDVKYKFKAYMRVEDTCGLPELMDILPAFSIGPGLYLLFVNLQNDLDHHYKLSHCDKSGTSTPSVESGYTVKELLLTCLSSISCSKASLSTSFLDDQFNISNVEDIVKNLSVAYIVGTHKDKVSQQQINKLNEELIKIIETTDFYKEDIIQFYSEKELIVALDNLKGGTHEIQQVKDMLEKIMERHFRRLRVPAVWLIFSLLLRRRNKRTASLHNCMELSASLHMTHGETEVALWFLHHHAGVLMYFPNIPDLQDLVIIDNQILYDSVTHFILRALNVDEVGHYNVQKFREAGQFSITQLTTITSRVSGDFIPIHKLVVLLEYLHIIARISRDHTKLSFDEDVYIMPCVLDSANKEELDTISKKPHKVCPIMVRFKCGFVPIGIFPAMIACLVSNQLFSVITGRIRKNFVQFYYGVHRTLVTLLCRSMYYELIAEFIIPEIDVHKECSALRIEIEASLDRVCSHMNYGALVKYEFAFDCPIHTECGRDHLCVVNREDRSPVMMECLQDIKDQTLIRLTDQHKLWYGKGQGPKTLSAQDEIPFYLPVQFEEKIQRYKPKEKVDDINYEEYCNKIEFILYTVCDFEFNAALTYLEKPSIEDNIDNVATNLKKNVCIGSFAGGPIALVQGSTKTNINQFINEILEIFPEVKYFISVGVGLGFQQTEMKLGDVFISSGFTVVDNYSTTDSDTTLHIKGDYIRTDELLQRLFCIDSTVSQTFCVTAQKRIADYHVSSVVLSTSMAEDSRLYNKTIIIHPSVIGIDSSARELFKLQKSGIISGFIVIKSVAGYVNGKRSGIWNVTGALAAVNYVEQKMKPYMDHVTAVDQYESAIKSDDIVDVRVAKLIFLGPSKHGKTTTRWRLTKAITNVFQSTFQESNTGVNEQSVVIACKDVLRDTAFATDKSDWISIDEWEELQFCLNAEQATKEPIKSSKQCTVTKPVIHQQSHEFAKEPEQPKPKNETARNSRVLQERPNQVSLEGESVHPTSSEISAVNVEWGRRVFNDLNHKKDYLGTWKKRLDKGILIYMHDTGGQPELMECLPVLTIGPALYLLFCKLSSKLDEKYEIAYRDKETKSLCIQSNFTIKETILSALSSIASMSYSSPNQAPETNQVQVRRRCVYLIGTHYDEVKDNPEAIFQLESKLKETLQLTYFYKEDLVAWWHEEGEALPKDRAIPKDKALSKNKPLGKKEIVYRLLYPIDNMFGDDKEVEYLRSSIHKGLDQLYADRKIPTTWLVFGILLRRRKESCISLYSCYELGRKFGMIEKTTKSVLHFLHYDIGICMYFSNIPSLKKIVIPNSQAVYSSLTMLIETAFKPTEVRKAAVDIFKETGQFSIEDFQVALQASSLPLEILVHILKHLNIIAPVQEKGMFFMPCILRNASNDEITDFTQAQLSSLTPLFVRYKCGFVPIGVFSSMMANLLQKSSQKVVLKPSNLRRNHVQFGYGLDIITFIHTSEYIKILVTQRSKKKTHELCDEVRVLVKNTLESVRISMLDSVFTKPQQYRCQFQSYQFAFNCNEHPKQKDLKQEHPKHEHLCIVNDQDMSDMWTTCLGDNKNNTFELKEEHLIWYGKILSSTSQGSSLSPASRPTLSKLHLLKKICDGKEQYLRIINEVRPEWKTIGCVLGLSLSDIQAIEKDACNVTDRCRDVFCKWLQHEDSSEYPVTWQGLHDLLQGLEFSITAKKLGEFFK